MEILYEDNHLLVAVKPRNMPIAADSSGDADMLTSLKSYVKTKYNKPGAVYLGLVHRLDRPVGGVVVFARTSKAAARLTRRFAEHTAGKEYLAVVCGQPHDAEELSDYIVKDRETNTSRIASESEPCAKLARLAYETVSRAEGLALLRVRLFTGRAHQIRVQLAAAKLPIWGDQRYNRSAQPGQQIALWAHKLTLAHPTKGEALEFIAPPPHEYPFNLFKP